VPVDGKTVLVVTVEASTTGHPIFTLRREFDRYLSGTVFVRKQGRTVQADATDMDALQRRLTAVARTDGASLEVNIVGDVPLSWFDPATVGGAVERMAYERCRGMIQRAHAEEERRPPQLRPRERSRPTWLLYRAFRPDWLR
jgi:hypothetical protein